MQDQPNQQPDDRELPPFPEDQQAEATTAAQVAQLQGELDDLQSRLLRLSADYQNYVRRSQQNVEDARQHQKMDVARSLLTVLDHFDRALEVDPKKTSAENLLVGVRMVREELDKMLDQYGVKRMPVSPGDPFDPTRHEALMHQKAPGVARGHVASQLQPGYLYHDKTLRPAKVAVAE